MSELSQLAMQHAQIVIPADVLVEFLREDRVQTFMEGVREGMRRIAVEAERPLSIKETANALGIGESNVKYLRKVGELEAMEYGGRVLFDPEEIRRFKRTHKFNNHYK